MRSYRRPGRVRSPSASGPRPRRREAPQAPLSPDCAFRAFFRPGLTSDAGALLLGAAERAIDLVDRFADCLITAVTDRWMRRDRRMGELSIRQWLLRPRVRTHLRDDQTGDLRRFLVGIGRRP